MDNAGELRWQRYLTETYDSVVEQIVAHLPHVIGAVALVLFGFLIAHMLRALTKKILHGLDAMIRKFIKHSGPPPTGIDKPYATLISRVVFWAVLLFFVASASNMLGWKLFSGWMDSLIRLIPSFIVGFLIILGGFIVGHALRSTVIRASARAGLVNSELLALIIQTIVVLAAIIVGVEQVGVNVGFLTLLIAVVVGVLLFGMALAFGFGAQTLVANIVGAQHTRKHCHIGEVLKIGDIEGEILEISQTSIILETREGRTIIPAKQFNEQISTVTAQSEPGSVFGHILKKKDKTKEAKG